MAVVVKNPSFYILEWMPIKNAVIFVSILLNWKQSFPWDLTQHRLKHTAMFWLRTYSLMNLMRDICSWQGKCHRTFDHLLPGTHLLLEEVLGYPVPAHEIVEPESQKDQMSYSLSAYSWQVSAPLPPGFFQMII